jgi:hypothetical protein
MFLIIINFILILLSLWFIIYCIKEIIKIKRKEITNYIRYLRIKIGV